MTKIEDFKQKQAEDLANLIACEALREKLTDLDPRLSDVSIFKSNLYGVDFWVTIDSSLVGISEMSYVIDKLPIEPMVRTRGSTTSFKTQFYVDTLGDDDLIIKENAQNILPFNVLVSAAPFQSMYEINSYRKVGDSVVRFSLKTNSQLGGLRIDRTFNNTKLIDINLLIAGSMYTLFSDDGESIADISRITWWSDTMSNASWSVYWTPNVEEPEYTLHSLVHLLSIKD